MLNRPLFQGVFSCSDGRGKATDPELGAFLTGAALCAFPGSEILSCRSRMMVSKTCVRIESLHGRSEPKAIAGVEVIPEVFHAITVRLSVEIDVA